jgi:hypothetical protein
MESMTDIDPESEQHRLAGLYARMLDEQLQELSGDPFSLTDIARQTLSAEIARRNLPSAGVEPTASTPEPESVSISGSDSNEIELLDLVVLRQFRDLPEAILARGILDSAGIESFLADENIVRMDWFISNLVGGIKLKVRREDLEDATLILETPGELRESDEVDT